jgi:hypothetical protein
MERTHGRHQRDFAALAAKRCNGSPKRIYITDYLHRPSASDTGLMVVERAFFVRAPDRDQEGQPS